MKAEHYQRAVAEAECPRCDAKPGTPCTHATAGRTHLARVIVLYRDHDGSAA